MIWLGVGYTDGTRVHHAFPEALLYVAAGRVHVSGTALCGVQFTGDRSGSRVDVVRSLLMDGPAEAGCEGCLAAEGN